MQLTEIRWHGRGGQGVKTAATLVAEVAMETGMYTQGFPEYGPERSGAPVRGFTRISDVEIRMHCAIENPDIIVVLDPSLLETGDVCDGVKPNSVILVNTDMTPEEVRKKINISEGKIYTLDAQTIALKEIGRPIPNIPLIGALSKITGKPEVEAIKKGIRKKFGHKFSEKVVEGNLRAIERSYNEVKTEK